MVVNSSANEQYETCLHLHLQLHHKSTSETTQRHRMAADPKDPSRLNTQKNMQNLHYRDSLFAIFY